MFFRSLIFTIFINSWGAIIPMIFLLPALILRSRKIADTGAKIWSIVSLWMLKKLCHIDHKIIGAENILREPCIYACKHQSMWETIVMHLILKYPVYAYKKELEIIPFYGWFLKVMSGIKIDRAGGAKALKSLIAQSKKYLHDGQSIVLFPQGTRVPVQASVQDYPYQAGIVALYNSCNVKIVPVALNSGNFWPKRGKKSCGTITIQFLPPIDRGLSREDFQQTLVEAIENASISLNG